MIDCVSKREDRQKGNKKLHNVSVFLGCVCGFVRTHVTLIIVCFEFVVVLDNDGFVNNGQNSKNSLGFSILVFHRRKTKENYICAHTTVENIQYSYRSNFSNLKALLSFFSWVALCVVNTKTKWDVNKS